MKIFDSPFIIKNEVVKRNTNDNRRLKTHGANGGNNIFYLGNEEIFTAKFAHIPDLIVKLQNIRGLLNDKTRNRNPTVIQNNEGIPVQHKISKKSLLSLLSFLKSFLEEHGNLYHNPNLDYDIIIEKLNEIEGENLLFNSDLVFIHGHDNIIGLYFKWFTQKDSTENWKLIQEFFIPKLSFLNFIFEKYQNDVFEVSWELTYAPSVVIYPFDNLEEEISNLVEKLIIDEEKRETIKEAITKIRIGQSQFRKNILNSNNNSCAFTEINDPELLIASHIKPWKESTNKQRRDFNNGLLLTPTFDKLFDKFLITFSEQGAIVWTTNRLTKSIIEKLKLSITVDKESLININESNRTYFEFHRQKFNELEKKKT